ncbi:MAG: hypothetical protein HUJ68_04875, partial [Clostridia bacterium]|nr:hypothetical protein [Clostridia bacterium]
MIKKSLRESEKPLNDFKVVWNNFKAYKEAVLGEAATYKDACQIREAVAAANKKGIFLKEAQIPTKTNRIVESEEKEEKGKKEECECKKGEECKESASLKEDIAPAPAPEGVPAP